MRSLLHERFGPRREGRHAGTGVGLRGAAGWHYNAGLDKWFCDLHGE